MKAQILNIFFTISSLAFSIYQSINVSADGSGEGRKEEWREGGRKQDGWRNGGARKRICELRKLYNISVILLK